MTLRLPPQPVGVRTPSSPGVKTPSSTGARVQSGTRNPTLTNHPLAQQQPIPGDPPPSSRFKGSGGRDEASAQQPSGADSRRSMAGLGARTRALTVEMPVMGATGANSAPPLDQVRDGSASIGRGQSGDSAARAQELIRAAGYESPTDGRFGPATERAVQSFQVDNGLEASGRVDRETLSALEGGDAPPPAPVFNQPVVVGGNRELDLTEAQRLSAATLTRHAAQPHTLTDREQVGELIRRTPHPDASARTAEDQSRSVGAAVLSGLLLDGNPSANAGAMERAAQQVNTPPNANEGAALRAMQAGTLTVQQAAHLQGLLNRMLEGHALQRAARSTTATHDVGALVAGLESHGGFANTRDLSLDVERVQGLAGSQVFHWTVSSRTQDGQTAHADPWPNPDGYAVVQKGLGPARDFTPGVPPSPGFEGEVFLDRTAGGSSTSVVGRVHNADGRAARAARDGFAGEEFQRGTQPLQRQSTSFDEHGYVRE